MTIHTLPRHALAEYRDQCEQAHLDRRRAGDTDTGYCDDGADNDVTQWLRTWRTGVAEAVARVGECHFSGDASEC